MADLNIIKVNEVFVKITADKSILKELWQYFGIYVEKWQFMRKKNPKFYNWDGKIRLFNMKTKQIYYSLLPEVCDFAKARKYSVELSDEIKDDWKQEKVSLTWIDKVNKELPFDLRDYQINAFVHAMQKKRCIIISPTSSGKSLIIYMMCKWLLDGNKAKKILVITPVTSLVEQLTFDFKEYGSKYPVHMIYGGKDKVSKKAIYVSTWQSIYEFGQDYFKNFDCVIQDEAHTGVNTNPKESKAIKGMLENCINAKYRIGLTGTLRQTKDKLLPVVGLLGETYKAISTRELMDKKQVTNLKINVIKLKYSEPECQARRKYRDWHEEISFIEAHYIRNMFVVKFINNLKKNTLILFRHRAHGQFIHKELLQMSTNTVEYVDGETPVSDREDIRKMMEKKNDVYLVASYGTFATGINIKNLHNIVFASPMKSEVKVNQSIGRGLRLHEKKENTILYDIADDFCIGAYKNYAIKHLVERLKIYNAEEFDYEEFDHKFKE